MPIVSISKIQHRYGLQDDLPQLSAAELGWTIDQQKLYIGNGPTSEGAPSIGNTEILTQHTNILEVANNAYTYKDSIVGYTAKTGVTEQFPVKRSLQDKLDDIVNVRDYGAKGDSSTDDTSAINRALIDLFTRDINPIVRRILYFPAGVYLINNSINIPPHTKIVGEGKDASIIRLKDQGSVVNSSILCVAQTTDTLMQVDSNIGTNGALFPTNVNISNIAFDANNTGVAVFKIRATSSSLFSNVKFDGGKLSTPVSISNRKGCVELYSTPSVKTEAVHFNYCDFVNNDVGVLSDEDINNVSFSQSNFNSLYRGIMLGEQATGSGSSVLGPNAISISSSKFDNIYSVGLYAFKGGIVTSAFNYFGIVGNHNSIVPNESNIVFNTDFCASINDTFVRSDVDSNTVARISYSTKSPLLVSPRDGILVGQRVFAAGGVSTLANNVISATVLKSFPMIDKARKIRYIAQRGSNVREGTITLVATATGVCLSDDFNEDANIGLTFTAVVNGANVDLKYLTTNTGNTTLFKYAIDRIIV